MTGPPLPASRVLRDEFFQRERDLLAQLAHEGQKPRIMFVGCSDSRVIPEWLAGARPGDLFVVRNVANIIPPYGTAHVSMGAAIEFAVDRLRVEHLIVCGHTDCGGIKALDRPPALTAEPSIAGWLKFARPAQKKADARGTVGGDRHQAIVEENVLLQLENLQTHPAVRDALAHQQIELHGWVYDLASRQIRYYDPAQRRFVAFSADS